jgi:hypothetical protein
MTDKRNATASWSGYLHQGKVGVFVALKKLKELRLYKEPIQDWKIVFENAEDFDIVCGDTVNSRHQVKAYNDASYPNDVKDVLSILEFEEKGDQLVIKQPGFKVREYSERGEPLEENVPRDSRFLHTITEIRGFELDKISFERDFPRAKFIENPNEIKLFQYPNGNYYCPLSDDSNSLENFIFKEIENILEFEGNSKSESEDYKICVLEQLLLELDCEIRLKHIQGSGSHPEVGFSRILEIVLDSNPISCYQEFRARKTFSMAYQMFKVELSALNIAFDDGEKNADEAIEKIYQLEREDFFNALVEMHPDASDFEDTQNINSLGLRRVFFASFLNLSGFSTEKMCFTTQEGRKLIPTTVMDNSIIVVQNIIQNPRITQSLFEKGHIINLNFSMPLLNLFTRIGAFSKFKLEDGSLNWIDIQASINDGDIFVNPKDIELIKISDLDNRFI